MSFFSLARLKIASREQIHTHTRTPIYARTHTVANKNRCINGQLADHAPVQCIAVSFWVGWAEAASLRSIYAATVRHFIFAMCFGKFEHRSGEKRSCHICTDAHPSDQRGGAAFGES